MKNCSSKYVIHFRVVRINRSEDFGYFFNEMTLSINNLVVFNEIVINTTYKFKHMLDTLSKYNIPFSLETIFPMYIYGGTASTLYISGIKPVDISIKELLNRGDLNVINIYKEVL